MAAPLGDAACRQAGLVNELLEAEATHRLSRYKQSLLRLHLLILHKVGFVPFTKMGADLLFSCARASSGRSRSVAVQERRRN